MVGEELDQRFKAMPTVPGPRHFKKGISHGQQCTTTEYKEMQKVFVVLIAGAVDVKVLAVVQALIDFAYYAQYHLHLLHHGHGTWRQASRRNCDSERLE